MVSATHHRWYFIGIDVTKKEGKQTGLGSGRWYAYERDEDVVFSL